MNEPQTEPKSNERAIQPSLASLKKEAKNGNVEALFDLGNAYYYGEGVKQNDVQAVTNRSIKYFTFRWDCKKMEA